MAWRCFAESRDDDAVDLSFSCCDRFSPHSCSGRGLGRRLPPRLATSVLGMGIGIGLVSECYFTALVSGRPVQLFEILLLCAAGTGAVLKCKDARCGFCGMPDRSGGDRLVTQCLSGAFALLLFLDLAVFAWVISRRQRGGWDAWAIWNLRAHFLYRDSAVAWRDAFTETLDWSHPDYPLLVPAFVARGWKSLGRESTCCPNRAGWIFHFRMRGPDGGLARHPARNPPGSSRRSDDRRNAFSLCPGRNAVRRRSGGVFPTGHTRRSGNG